MNYYWYFSALAIGYYFARINGLEAVKKINKYYSEKENKNQTNS